LEKHLYIFSGLGADERAFQYLDFSTYNTSFINWVPVYKNETIKQYATRLLSQVQSKHPVLIGLSFGGIMAIEVAKQIKTEKVIIIASVKNKNEIPFYYHFAGKLNLHKLLPSKLFKRSYKIMDYFFGINNSDEKKILRQILSDTDPVFLKWAIDKIVKWQNTDSIPNLYHIHGMNDRILPVRFIYPDFIVEEGGHLMVISKSREIMGILKSEIENINLNAL